MLTPQKTSLPPTNFLQIMKESEITKESGIYPDQIAYTSLIAAFCNTGEMNKADALFHEMLREGCSPNVVNYTCFINAYLKSNMNDQAHELYKKMKERGVKSTMKDSINAMSWTIFSLAL
jgi:pentatricopeptide repeat protein